MTVNTKNTTHGSNCYQQPSEHYDSDWRQHTESNDWYGHPEAWRNNCNQIPSMDYDAETCDIMPAPLPSIYDANDKLQIQWRHSSCICVWRKIAIGVCAGIPYQAALARGHVNGTALVQGHVNGASLAQGLTDLTVLTQSLTDRTALTTSLTDCIALAQGLTDYAALGPGCRSWAIPARDRTDVAA